MVCSVAGEPEWVWSVECTRVRQKSNVCGDLLSHAVDQCMTAGQSKFVKIV